MSDPYDFGEKKSISVLGPTLSFKGELKAEEELLIRGRVEGSIEHTSNLTIGEDGNVKADIKAEFIAIEGRVEGDMQGTKSVVVKDTANVKGNIFSPTVSLHEGSTFNGKIDMSGNAKPQQKSRDGDTKGTGADARSESKTEGSDDNTKSTDNKSGQNRKRASNAA